MCNPTAEESDSKSVQCGFESHHTYVNSEMLLAGALVGKRIIKADNDTLTLEDGTVRLYESDSDCCASASGSWVTHPENLDAVITAVKVTGGGSYTDCWDGTENYATVTIFHNQNKLAQADCYANDGNGGYYYSALSVDVNLDDVTLDFVILSA